MRTASAEIHVYPDLPTASRALAERLVGQLHEVVGRKNRCTLVLAGGSTPQSLYDYLAAEYAETIPWEHVHIFWGDERFVPPVDASSNARMAREALLDHVPIPRKNIHPMPTDYDDPEVAARAYEEMLRGVFDGVAWPAFDLMLLGLGADGHTASLFPGSVALKESERWVAPVEVPSVEPPRRLTLTLPALNHAEQVHFLVFGAEKADAVECAQVDPPNVERCPASAVRLVHGTLTWWLDAEAASRIVKEK